MDAFIHFGMAAEFRPSAMRGWMGIRSILSAPGWRSGPESENLPLIETKDHYAAGGVRRSRRSSFPGRSST